MGKNSSYFGGRKLQHDGSGCFYEARTARGGNHYRNEVYDGSGREGKQPGGSMCRLGADVTIVGKVGNDDFGKTLLETAAAAGVNVSKVLVDPVEATGVAHITLEVSENDAKNRITVCPGANFSLCVDEIAWLKKRIADFDIVMMQLELPIEVVEAVAAWPMRLASLLC